MTRTARITATGMAVPDTVASNALLSRCMTTSDEWITQRTGIRERGLDGRIDSTLTVTDLALEASRMALKNAGLNNIDRYGNTAAASVPICLHEALSEGRIKDGDLVMLVAFGTGFSWGATLLRW